MRTALPASLCLLCIGAITLSAVAEPQGKGKIRLMVVTGGHGFQRDPFFAIFEADEGVEYDEFQQPKANEAYVSGKADEYDAILLYDMVQEITEEQKAALVRLLKEEGKGLVVLHHALASYSKWEEYAKIAGGRYWFEKWELDGQEMPPSTFKHGVEFTVQIASKKHPITKGMEDFKILDEVYGGFYVSPQVTPLLRTDHPESGEIVGWVHTYGKARVATIQLGHDAHAYSDDNYRQLVSRSIRWVARRKVGR
ncbi:MAG: ThuA domain-containing protein [Armatimonadota bacterium]